MGPHMEKYRLHFEPVDYGCHYHVFPNEIFLSERIRIKCHPQLCSSPVQVRLTTRTGHFFSKTNAFLQEMSFHQMQTHKGSECTCLDSLEYATSSPCPTCSNENNLPSFRYPQLRF